ncbi:MAG: ABC transporter ATP-binding protein [bacterium]
MNPVITIHKLQYAWPGQASLLDIEHMQIQQGERVMLSGASGSGKSTLLGLLTGVISGASGEISVMGKDLARLKPDQCDALRGAHIGYIFQSFNLVPYLSVIENVTLPCRLSKQRAAKVHGSLIKNAKELLAKLGLSQSVLHTRQVTQLSVGQQQRIAAARALIGAPEIIIADEPTSALDEDSKNDFLKLLLDLSAEAGSTVLFVSHDKTLMPHFDRILNMTELNQASTSLQKTEKIL